VTSKPRIVVFSGSTATIANSPALVTSNKARLRHGLPLLTGAGDEPLPDVLRPQRLAAPVTVYVEAYTAHPLEPDAVDLYAAPDGWITPDGTFHDVEPATDAKPVHVVELRPEDGLVPLPYMARQSGGSAWEDAEPYPGAPASGTRQTFYPDASRIYEEIERLGVDGTGNPVGLSRIADFDFVRAAPPAGWTHGRAAGLRTDLGEGDIAPEELGRDFQGYAPGHLAREPALETLAGATNIVQRTLDSGEYAGAQWLEGSPTNEETMYWLGLVIDTTLPLVGHSAQRAHGSLSADGDRNIVDGVAYITSGIALDDDGRDRVGAVMVVDELVFAARDVMKTDARPGNYVVTGGHGGPVADLGGGGPELTYVPQKKHTYRSDVRITTMPATVQGVTDQGAGPVVVDVHVKDEHGGLRPEAMPVVTFTKFGRYVQSLTGAEGVDISTEVEVLARTSANLAESPLAGFVAEGMSPYGFTGPTNTAALHRAVFSGMPVVRVGRGNTGGKAYEGDPFAIPGNNLTATKARILLMAALLRLGALPPAVDPANPTDDERAATVAALAAYREIFATH
jgi:L-asparaginase/Glu-tRNA(Gln) amidotransferase subunit D